MNDKKSHQGIVTMKPSSGDHRHRLLITGDELNELKRHTWGMAEAFGLDRKIENYKGSRPITLYRWDMECLMDVIDVALKDEREYPDHSSAAYLALKNLGDRLHQEYDSVYGHEKTLPASVSKKATGRTDKKPSARKLPQSDDKVYQFKVTLLETRPLIWRRIQVKDCTLDKLHEHIQTAMGWTNSHLHHFKLGERLYGDPRLMADKFEELEYLDSMTTKSSDILPKTRKKFRFVYEYDFGDSWEHEVLFEGIVPPDSKVKYPLCVEGARACPPDDCGGVWGYADFLEAIGNKKHKQHREMLEWIGGRFDSEDFDPAAATKAMNKGLPDWRLEAGW